MNGLDQSLFFILNKYNHPVIDYIYSWITRTIFWTPLYIFLLFFIKKYLGWRGVALFILTIFLSDQCTSAWLKPLFARYRPCYALPISSIHLVGEYKGIYGFPSSHASNTYSFAMLFWKVFKANHRFSYLFFIWATIVSYGRIYGGMHYPLDVFCGAMVGGCIGLLIYQVYQSSKWSVED